MSKPLDPLARLPDPATLRGLIAEQVRRTQQLRQLLRLSLRREAERPPRVNPRSAGKAVAGAR